MNIVRVIGSAVVFASLVACGGAGNDPSASGGEAQPGTSEEAATGVHTISVVPGCRSSSDLISRAANYCAWMGYHRGYDNVGLHSAGCASDRTGLYGKITFDCL